MIQYSILYIAVTLSHKITDHRNIAFFRQSGQELLRITQIFMQFRWKMWLHGSLVTYSSSEYYYKHKLHQTPSSAQSGSIIGSFRHKLSFKFLTFFLRYRQIQIAWSTQNIRQYARAQSPRNKQVPKQQVALSTCASSIDIFSENILNPCKLSDRLMRCSLTSAKYTVTDSPIMMLPRIKISQNAKSKFIVPFLLLTNILTLATSLMIIKISVAVATIIMQIGTGEERIIPQTIPSKQNPQTSNAKKFMQVIIIFLTILIKIQHQLCSQLLLLNKLQYQCMGYKLSSYFF